jgi:hypothetical protein
MLCRRLEEQMQQEALATLFISHKESPDVALAS